MNDIIALASRLKMLRESLKDLEQEVEEFKKEIASVEAQLAEQMTESEVGKFEVGGQLFYLHQQDMISPKADTKETLKQVLRDQGYGDLIQETINAQTFGKFARELKEENADELPDWLNGLVSVFPKTSVRQRKA